MDNYRSREAIDRYVSGIRNKAKRDYAERYRAWVNTRRYRDDVIHVAPEYKGLSYMAAQAVRLTLDASDEAQSWGRP